MENTIHLREYFGLSQKELSDFFGIPLRTITNWDNRKCMPKYVYEMMRSILWTAFFTLEKRMEQDLDISAAKEYHETFLDCLKMTML